MLYMHGSCTDQDSFELLFYVIYVVAAVTPDRHIFEV